MNDRRCDALLTALGLRFGMPGLCFDRASGSCTLRFGGRLSVSLTPTPDEQALVLFAELGTVKAQERPDLLLAMLSGNVMWRGTAGATLCLQAEREQAIMVLQLPIDGLDGASLETRLGHFVDAAMRWSERLAAPLPPAALPPADPAGMLLRV